MAGVRPFEPSDAERAAELLLQLSPASVQTAHSLRHRQVSEPPRARRKSWVALDDNELIAFATANVAWFGGEAGKGRIWVGVHPRHRRRGIGTGLWDTAVARLAGTKRLTVEVDDDPAGLRFVEQRGFTQYDSEVISRLDPGEGELETRPHEGFRVLPLGDLQGRERELYQFYGEAGAIPPGDPENRVTLEEWQDFILGNPLLDHEGSVVVLDAEDRVVSLSWLLVDHSRRRAENEWTGTAPHLRGRGLARLAKVATIRWAVERGLTEIVTGNDPDNLPMRELNRRLGYKELFLRRDLEQGSRRSDEPRELSERLHDP
jgi:GNAT superfamily N-acetyltransferase